jgi:hypothetical protein
MISRRRQRTDDREDRLHAAESAAEVVEQKGEDVIRQLSLVERLTEGWHKVHQTNHLAQLFKDEGHIG